MFQPDRPIESCKEDILGREFFAKSLGNAILSYKEKDSIAIGLFGAWGSGKTSVINMMLEHIESISKNKNNDEKPIIVKFNPWNYSDQNQLLNQFFKQLSIALGQHNHTYNIKKVGKLLKTYAQFFEPIPNIGPIATLFKNIGNSLSNLGEDAENLSIIKTKLNKLLSKESRKIIIVIDDIDRLNNTEIRQIFQLVKSLGDFSNTIYLLAFDKNIVVNALKKVQEGSGKEYLEKVIQIPFEIPLISKQEIKELLYSQLDKLIKDLPEDKWNQQYWNEIYKNGLKYFFNNIRDITRYINILRFSFELVKHEVNPVDFFAITGLQIFVPEIYYEIRNNKDIFSGTNTYIISDIEKEEIKVRYDEIIGKAPESFSEILKNFLMKLFPKLEEIYTNIDTTYSQGWLNDWRKNGRICSPDIFDTFFMLSIPKEEISKTELEEILLQERGPESFSDIFLEYKENGKITRFLERIKDYINDIPEKNIESIIVALMDVGDLLSDNSNSIYILLIVSHLFQIFIHRFDSYEKRFNVFKDAMEKAERSIYTIVDEVYRQNQEHEKHNSKSGSDPKKELTVNPKQFKELKKIACKKIENWANEGRLKKYKYLAPILLLWKNFGNEEIFNKFVKNMTENDEALINFIHSYSYYRIKREDIEKVVNLKEIVSRIEKIQDSPNFEKLDDQKKITIKKFLKEEKGVKS